jgi:hypothetical protein
VHRSLKFFLSSTQPLTALYFTSICRRGYVIAVKNEREPDDPGKVVYSLGVRFAVDLGKRRLIRAHYATNGQDMDKSVLKDIVEEEEAEELRRKPAEAEEENE